MRIVVRGLGRLGFGGFAFFAGVTIRIIVFGLWEIYAIFLTISIMGYQQSRTESTIYACF